MAKNFYVKIVSGSDAGPYNIYYDQVSSENIATNFNTSLLATGVTYTELTINLGFHVSVPDSATKLIVYNTNTRVITECESNIDETFLPTPTPTSTATATPTSTETPTPTPSPSPSSTETPTPTPTGTPTPTPSPSPSPTETPTSTPTSTPIPTSTPTPTPTPNCDFYFDLSVNHSPTDISLTNNTINENNSINTIIGALSTSTLDTGDTHTYSIVGGSSNFNISGDNLRASVVFNYESITSYNITIRTTDSIGQFYDKLFTIFINNVNEAPYGLSINNDSQQENTSIGMDIGTFSTLDVDANNTFTYSLYDTSNFQDNNSFTLTTSGVLRNAVVFNFEVKNSYSIRVRTTDAGGLTYEGTFTINVTNQNESPTDINLSSSSISENVPIGTNVGTLSATDPDSGDTFTFTLVDSGTFIDNNSFSINSTTLKSNAIFDFEAKNSYSIRVRVTDAGGLALDKTITITITNVTIVVTASSTTNVTCNGGNDGVITVSNAVGGTASYTYSRDGVNYQVGTTFGSLTAGSYTIYAKDSYGEIGTTSVTVTQSSAVSASISSSANPTCWDGNNGSISVSGSGGTGSYTYSKDGTNYQSSATFSTLTTGTYTLYVKDSNGCVASTTITLSKSVPNATISITNATCHGGTGTIVITSGTGGSGSGYEAKLNVGGTYTPLTATFSTLSVGTYTIYIKDGSGCAQTYSATINQPTVVTITTTSLTYTTCWDGSDGQVILAASGGSGVGFQYRVDGGAWQNSSTFSGLGANIYYFEAKDSNGCVSPNGVTVNFTKSQPNCTKTVTNVLCHGGSGSISVSSPNGSNSGVYTVSINNGTYQSFPHTFSGLGAGTYTIRVKDYLGCIGAYSVTVTQPSAALNYSVQSTSQPTCFGSSDGSISVLGTNGTPPYTYSKDAGNYQSSGVFSNLTSGFYFIYVRDSNNCDIYFGVDITRSAPNATISVTNPDCNAGTGTITVSGGSGGSGSGYRAKNGSGGSYTNLPVSYSSLGSGTYSIFISDSLGCEQSYSATVTVPSAVSGSFSGISFPTCYNYNNGSLTVVGGGGASNGGYKYAISTNGGSYSAYTAFKNSHTFSNLVSGNHSIIVLDSNSCYAIISYNLTVSAPELGSVTVNDVSCFGGSNGSIVVSTLNGGSSPRTVSINDVDYFYPSHTFSSLTSGVYTLYVKDGNDCVETYSRTINQPTSQSVSLTVVSIPTCENGSDAVLQLSSSGGVFPKTYRLYADTTSPYTTCGGDLVGTYSTSTFGTTFNVGSLTSYGYCLEVTDANGCVINSGVVVVSPCIQTGGICYSVTYSSMPNDMYVRYRDVNDTIQTSLIIGLFTLDNGDGTYTAAICVKQGSSYSYPVYVQYGSETFHSETWIEGGLCGSNSECLLNN